MVEHPGQRSPPEPLLTPLSPRCGSRCWLADCSGAAAWQLVQCGREEPTPRQLIGRRRHVAAAYICLWSRIWRFGHQGNHCKRCWKMNAKSSLTSTPQTESEIRQSCVMLSKTEIHSRNIFRSIKLYSLLFTGLPLTVHILSWGGCLTRQPGFCHMHVFLCALANQT